jgi:hypothetical protein
VLLLVLLLLLPVQLVLPVCFVIVVGKEPGRLQEVGGRVAAA